MFKYIVKRLLLSVVILFGASVIIYALVRLMPMDYVEQKFSGQLAMGNITQADLDHMKELYGLSGSIWNGYWNWIGNVFKGDLGMSFIYQKPVAALIVEKMKISFILSLIATVLQFLISIPLGIVSAKKQYGVTDYTVTILAMMGISLPSFFFAALLMKVFAVDLGWFPLQGMVDATKVIEPGSAAYVGDVFMHLVLPMVVLVVLSIGGLMRYTRTNMLEVLNSDYIRTARAKGASEHAVIYKHAFRNTLIPLVTMMAGILPSLFGGAMITETVFAIPGIGQAAYKAVVQGDVPLIMSYNLFGSFLSIIGVLLSDLMYAVVDPRVKLGG